MNQLKTDFFSFFEQLPADQQDAVMKACEPLEIGPGNIISQQESPSDSAYVVDRGVVEVVSESPDRREHRLIAYMSRGDFFGELGVLTGRPRSASVRAVDNVRVLKFSLEKFMYLLETVNGFGAFISAILADRMHRSTVRAVESSYSIDLGGNLSSFDLIVVFQTVNSGGQTGELRLYTPNNDLVGHFFFRNQRIDYAQYGHLTGIEALWQVLLETDVLGTFQFQITDHPTQPVDVDRKIAKPCSDLLMEAASKRDLYTSFPEEVRSLSRKVERLNVLWPTEGITSREKALTVWNLANQVPQPMSMIWRKGNESVLTLLQIFGELEAAGLIRVS